MVKYPAEFKHQSVRDMAWAVSSPPLISQPSCACAWPDSRWYQQIYQDTLPWLNGIDSDPAELDELLVGQKDRRLGKYFETLWFYWLTHHPRYQLIENNLQVIIDGKTLGEIDFIVFDKLTGQTMHWEVAVKFYLGVGDTREMSNWYGPNLRDRLDIKVEHLLQKQSVISRDNRVIHWLRQQGINIDQCTVVLKGRLFYPWCYFRQLYKDSGSSTAISPALCASDHLYSMWLSKSDFDAAFDNRQSFIPLIKNGWMERIPTQSVRNSYTKNSLNKTVSNNEMRYPLQVQLLNPRHSCDRAFITDDEWPTLVV